MYWKKNWLIIVISVVVQGLDLSLVERVDTVKVHFTLKGEDPKTQENCHEWKSTWIPTWQTINIVHHMSEFTWGQLPRGRTDADSNILCHWYNLWMRIKSPRNTWSQPSAHVWSGPHSTLPLHSWRLLL